jgi:hypothetical protein
MFLEQLANNIMPAKAKIVLLFIKKKIFNGLSFISGAKVSNMYV